MLRAVSEERSMANAAGRPTAPLGLEPEEREYLEGQVRRRRVSRSMSERCRIILRCADGVQSKVVAAELGVHEHTVGKWRRRFLSDRVEGLLDEVRPGRPRTIDDDQIAAVMNGRFARRPLMRRTGRSVRWRAPRASPIPQSVASGPPSGCSRTAR